MSTGRSCGLSTVWTLSRSPLCGSPICSGVPISCKFGLREKTSEMSDFEHKFSIAPMMDWTDRNCRFFHRLLTRRALIYTEMITTGAVIHGDRARLLGYD